VDSTIVTAVIGACMALLILIVVVLVARGRRARSEERFEAVLGQLDQHMGAISRSLERVVERSAAARVPEGSSTISSSPWSWGNS
jgi:hypothetical protein